MANDDAAKREQVPAAEAKPDSPGNSGSGEQIIGSPGGTAAPHPGKGASGETDRVFDGYLAEVVDVVRGRTGIYGEIKQAMCKIMEGKDKGRVIRRNFAGRIKKGDLIRLPDTSKEDKRIMAR